MTTAPTQPPRSIAVVMAVRAPEPTRLRRSLLSVRQQTTDAWELLVAAEPDEPPDVEQVLAWAERVPGVRIVRTEPDAGPARMLNAAVGLAASPWIALLGQHDLLEPEALEEVLAAATEHPDARVIYTDSADLDARGTPMHPFAKPDWSPRRLRGHNYVGDLVAVRASALAAAGGLRPEIDGAHVHDLLLRITEQGGDVVHISRVLYQRHLREATQLAGEGSAGEVAPGQRAVQEHLARLGLAGRVRAAALPGFWRVDRWPTPTTVSIVIPTRGGRGVVHGQERVFAVETVRSIVAHPCACDYEIVMVHDTDADRGYLETLGQLAGQRLRVVDFDPPFNFSAKVNLGVEASTAEVVVLLNDDVEVISPRWLDQLVALAQEKDVGAVGALLLFEDGTVQHAGHAFVSGEIRHVGFRKERSPGEEGSNVVDREVVGVTAAVLAQRRGVWEHVGGLDETLPNNFNDVDYCNRIRAKGYRIVQANSVRLFHFESKTRDARVASGEVRRIQDRLGHQLLCDPFTSRAAVQVDPPGRGLAEWIRVSRHVLREEGTRSFTAKARKRLGRR